MDENGLIGVLLSWLPMLLLIGVYVVYMRKYGAGRVEIVDEYRKHNELLRQVIERMDQRIARLENKDEAGK